MSHATSQTIRTETQAKKRLRLDPELAANLEEFDGLWTPERSGTLPQCMWVMIDVMKNRLWHDTTQNVRLVFNIKLLEYIRYLVELRLLKLRNDDAANRGVVMGEEAKEALKKKIECEAASVHAAIFLRIFKGNGWAAESLGPVAKFVFDKLDFIWSVFRTPTKRCSFREDLHLFLHLSYLLYHRVQQIVWMTSLGRGMSPPPTPWSLIPPRKICKTSIPLNTRVLESLQCLSIPSELGGQGRVFTGYGITDGSSVTLLFGPSGGYAAGTARLGTNSKSCIRVRDRLKLVCSSSIDRVDKDVSPSRG